MLLSILEETLGGLRIIKAFNAEKILLNKNLKKENNELHNLMVKVYRRIDLSVSLERIYWASPYLL